VPDADTPWEDAGLLFLLEELQEITSRERAADAAAFRLAPQTATSKVSTGASKGLYQTRSRTGAFPKKMDVTV